MIKARLIPPPFPYHALDFCVKLSFKYIGCSWNSKLRAADEEILYAFWMVNQKYTHCIDIGIYTYGSFALLRKLKFICEWTGYRSFMRRAQRLKGSVNKKALFHKLLRDSKNYIRKLESFSLFAFYRGTSYSKMRYLDNFAWLFFMARYIYSGQRIMAHNFRRIDTFLSLK